jgi:outer membrane receptor protein involved in Fe transport
VEGSASVDINTIPEDLIERVDVLTGGASAIYGADGVSGVVNFVLKKNFEGLTGRVQAGISKYGDAGQRYATLTAGHNFGDGRGNVALSYEFGDEDRLDVHRRINSNFTSLSYNPDYDRSVPGSYYRMPQKDVRYAWTSRKGAVDVDGDGIPDYLGTGAVYNQGRDLLYGNFTQGGDDTRTTDYMNDLRPATTRHVVNFIGHYDFSPVFQVFGEAKYVNTMSYSLAQPTFDYSMFVPGDNPYMPTSIRNAIDPGMGGVLVTRDNFDLGQRGERIKRETFRAVVGVRGDFGAGFHYEVSYNHGQTTITNHFVNDRYTDRWNAAIDAVTDPSTGKPTCRVNLDPTAADAITFTPGQCVPFNVFGEGQSSQAALAWLRADTTEHSRITQDVVSGQLSGDTHSFFTLPGGPIGFAVGAEYRKETSRFTPDPLEQQGLTFSNKLLPSHGSYDVKEVFGEVDLPFIKDRPFIHLLDVSAAIRYSNYSTIGSTTAWKVDATWAPVRDIRFRGTYSTAVRAPNIGELFGAASQTYAFFDDPCSAANRTLGKASRGQLHHPAPAGGVERGRHRQFCRQREHLDLRDLWRQCSAGPRTRENMDGGRRAEPFVPARVPGLGRLVFDHHQPGDQHRPTAADGRTLRRPALARQCVLLGHQPRLGNRVYQRLCRGPAECRQFQDGGARSQPLLHALARPCGNFRGPPDRQLSRQADIRGHARRGGHRRTGPDLRPALAGLWQRRLFVGPGHTGLQCFVV